MQSLFKSDSNIRKISWFKTDIFHEHTRYTLDAIKLSASIYTASPSWKPYEYCSWRGMVDCQIVAHLSLQTLNDSLIARFIGPTWEPSGADRSQVGSTLAPRILLSGKLRPNTMIISKIDIKHKWIEVSQKAGYHNANRLHVMRKSSVMWGILRWWKQWWTTNHKFGMNSFAIFKVYHELSLPSVSHSLFFYVRVFFNSQNISLYIYMHGIMWFMKTFWIFYETFGGGGCLFLYLQS